MSDLMAHAGHAQVATTARYVSPSLANRGRAVEDAQKVVPIRPSVTRAG